MNASLPSGQTPRERLTTGALQTAIFNSASVSTIATDARGVIQIFNVGAERMLGYAAADVVGKITPADISDPEEGIARAIALSAEMGTSIAPGFEALAFKASRGIEDIYELTYFRNDGSRLPALVSVTALRDAPGAIIGYLLIGTDVAARKRVEEEREKLDRRLRDQQATLQLKSAELEAASRMKSEFLANMSHELRTPLNAIIGFGEVLRDGLMGPLSGPQRAFVNDICLSGRHLLSLINDILDLSRVEAGRMTLDLGPVRVSSLFENSLSVVREKAAARRIRVELDAGQDSGVIQCDVRKVKQIVHNLLSNAVKFANDGSRVTLRVRRVPRAGVGLRTGTGDGRSFPLADSPFAEFLEISVADTGIGISSEGLERLFKPFSRVDSPLARTHDGAGLGLVMVKLLAELHGGTVAVRSAENEGSLFTVWLPFRAQARWRAAPLEATSPRPIEAPNGPPLALVVEHGDKAAELIRVLLEAEGFGVLHAASAEEALALAARQPISLITLDILLPGMDGWEFLSRIRQAPALKRVPVVIVSIVADRRKGFSLGATAVMQKPISREELHDSLVDLGLFPRAEGRPLTVLVVDDDPRAVELIAVPIGGLASNVLRAYGGREAIAAARREIPDLIVLDLVMPKVNGFDVVEALHDTPETAGIPILVVTAREITADDRARLNGSVATIVEKAAFNPDRFTAEVRRAMSGRQAAA